MRVGVKIHSGSRDLGLNGCYVLRARLAPLWLIGQRIGTGIGQHGIDHPAQNRGASGALYV